MKKIVICITILAGFVFGWSISGCNHYDDDKLFEEYESDVSEFYPDWKFIVCSIKKNIGNTQIRVVVVRSEHNKKFFHVLSNSNVKIQEGSEVKIMAVSYIVPYIHTSGGKEEYFLMIK